LHAYMFLFWFDSSIWKLQDLLQSRNPSSQDPRSYLKSFCWWVNLHYLLCTDLVLVIRVYCSLVFFDISYI
jgi:hypothetical protein